MMKEITVDRRRAIAARSGIGDAYLYQILTGRKVASPELCIAIERESKREVTCEELRPDVDWAYLRGTRKRKQNTEDTNA